MQIRESEIVIPFKYKTRIRSILIRASVFLVFSVGLVTFSIIMRLQIVARLSRFPDTQEMAQKDIVFSIAFLVLLLLFYSLFFIQLIRQLRGPSPYLRINHEGIFTSIDVFLFRWEEIRELRPFIFLGIPYLGFVLWNTEAVVLRVKTTRGPSLRFIIDINQHIAHFAKLPAPIGIAQTSLPISIDELLMTIQEHFATELRGHHIIVRGWQS